MDRHGWWRIVVAQDGSVEITQFAQTPYHARRPEHRQNTHDVTLKIQDFPEALVLLMSGYTHGMELVEADEEAMRLEDEARESAMTAEAQEFFDPTPDPVRDRLREMSAHLGLIGLQDEGLPKQLALGIGVEPISQRLGVGRTEDELDPEFAERLSQVDGFHEALMDIFDQHVSAGLL